MGWHTGERLPVVGRLIFVIIVSFIYAYIVCISWNFTTLRMVNGLPLAADFANYWSASKLALSGHPNLVYNINELHEVQQQVFGTSHDYGCGWYYPPIYLLMVLPLGLMPYVLSFSVWIGLSFILYVIILYRITPYPKLLALIVLFPGIYENFIYGQNGNLSGIFLGGGLLLLDSSPFVASILFGLLSFKPHFFILILIALIFGRYWKALISTIVTTIALSLISVLVFGPGVWSAYIKVMAIPMHLLETGSAAWSIMPTFFAGTLSLGLGVRAAYLVQGLVMLMVLSGVAWVWMGKANLALRGSVLTLGLLLFTPYAFIYDLALLALPLCWLWEEGRVRGRGPGELILLLCGWLMPFAVPVLWNPVNILDGKLQIGPVVLLALFLHSLAKANIGKNWTGGRAWLKAEKA